MRPKGVKVGERPVMLFMCSRAASSASLAAEIGRSHMWREAAMPGSVWASATRGLSRLPGERRGLEAPEPAASTAPSCEVMP